MTRETVVIDGEEFTLAEYRGAKLYASSVRTSQRGDPGQVKIAEWVFGPAMNSTEDTTFGPGYLGVSHTVNADTRWEGEVTLGPLINTVTLSTYDRTWTGSALGESTAKPGVNFKFGSGAAADNASGQAEFGQYAYIIRGQQFAKVKISDLTLKRSGVVWPEPATTILATRAETGVFPNEVSVGLGEQAPYQVLTLPSDHPNTDAWMPNDDGQTARVLASAPDRIVALTGQTVTGNILTGSNSMRSPNWNSVATIIEQGLRFTGFGLDGNLWVIITSDGPYLLDADTSKFFPLMPEIDNNDENGLGSGSWSQLGTIIALHDGATWLKSGNFEGFGVERFTRNTSEVQGYPTAHAATVRWLYQALLNETTGDTWIIAWRFRQTGDPGDKLLQPFTIAKFTDLECRYLRYIGTYNGVRTSPTLMGGYGSNLFYMTLGQTAREIDDTNYRFASSGQVFLTEMRRDPGIVKDLEACEFETEDCDDDQLIKVRMKVDGGSFETLQGALKYEPVLLRAGDTKYRADSLNGTVTTNGHQRLLFVNDARIPLDWASGYRFQPQLYFETDDSTSSPRVVGNFRLYYSERPKTVQDYAFSITVQGGTAGTAEVRTQRLKSLVGKGVRFLDGDNVTTFVRINAVEVQDTAGTSRRVRISATEWALRSD